jgi:hypothetical protein
MSAKYAVPCQVCGGYYPGIARAIKRLVCVMVA